METCCGCWPPPVGSFRILTALSFLSNSLSLCVLISNVLNTLRSLKLTFFAQEKDLRRYGERATRHCNKALMTCLLLLKTQKLNCYCYFLYFSYKSFFFYSLGQQSFYAIYTWHTFPTRKLVYRFPIAKKQPKFNYSKLILGPVLTKWLPSWKIIILKLSGQVGNWITLHRFTCWSKNFCSGFKTHFGSM